MEKYLKALYSVVLVFVILSPLINIKSADISNEVFNGEYVSYDENFLSFFAEKKAEYYEKEAEAIVSSLGIENTKAEVEYDFYDHVFTLKKITVYLKNAVINEKDGHINILTEIKDNVKKNTAFKDTEVVVYG